MLRKSEKFTISAVINGGLAKAKVGAVEYIMPKDFADEILKSRKGPEKNMPNQEFLIKYVNDECGLLYNCVKVTLN